MRKPDDAALHGWYEVDSTEVDRPGKIDALLNPYLTIEEQAGEQGATCAKSDAAEATSAAATSADAQGAAAVAQAEVKPIRIVRQPLQRESARAVTTPRDRTVIRLPAFEQVKSDPVLYAHASRVLHLETNPGNARALVQRHGEGHIARDVWINPPPHPA